MATLVVAILVTSFGAWLIRHGWWPRRVGNTPHCGKCGYILAGIQVERCPECGCELSPGSVVQGERRCNPTLISLGIAALLIGLFVGTTEIVDVFRKVDWYSYLPTAWLMRDLDAASATRYRAWTELQRRLLAGSLSADQRSRLVQRALREQQTGGDANGYFAAMTDFVGLQYLDHKLSAAEADAFLANALKLRLDVRPIVGRGDPIPFRISEVGHGPRYGWHMWERARAVWIDDKRFERSTISSASGLDSWSSLGSVESQPPGKHRLRVEVEIKAGGFNIGSNVPPRPLELAADVQVLSDQLPIQWTTSPGAAEIRKCLSAYDFISVTGQYRSLSGAINANRPPMNLPFDVFARINGNEYSLGPVVFHRSPMVNEFHEVGAPLLPPGNFRTIDVILRGSEKAAKNTVDITMVWQGEIVIRNVQVQQVPATQPVPAS